MAMAAKQTTRSDCMTLVFITFYRFLPQPFLLIEGHTRLYILNQHPDWRFRPSERIIELTGVASRGACQLEAGASCSERHPNPLRARGTGSCQASHTDAETRRSQEDNPSLTRRVGMDISRWITSFAIHHVRTARFDAYSTLRC